MLLWEALSRAWSVVRGMRPGGRITAQGGAEHGTTQEFVSYTIGQYAAVAKGYAPGNHPTPSQHQGGFRLPPGMSYTKEERPFGVAYVFRHQELGLLGRILLQDAAGGQCHVSMEVAGDPADPMTARRLEVFDPVAKDLVRRLEVQTGSRGGGRHVEPLSSPPEPGEVVESKLMQCERCDAGVALLIFADRATDHGGLEDYARKMYQQIVQMNVPTWVIGPPVGDAPLPERPADILKVWPEREPVQRLRPDEFNPIVGEFARAHCG